MAVERPDRGGTRTSALRALFGMGAAALVLAGLALWAGQGTGERAGSAPAPPLEEHFSVAGLRERVHVLRDRRGVPHVRAGSEAGAWTALGWLHGRDRGIQILWLRRLAQGRTAEQVGPAGLDHDRWARTLGLARLAEAEAKALPRSQRLVLEAYARGVNAALGAVGGSGPDAIEPWRPADSLAVWKLLAWGLSDTLEEQVFLSDLIEDLGPRAARPFFPRSVGLSVFPAEPTHSAEYRARPASGLRDALGFRSPGIGSTAFVVDGSRTRRGGALLLADTHLPPRAPAGLYEADLQGGELEVAGASWPGVPVFWIGFTPGVAFAATHHPAIVADLFFETLHAQDPNRYHDGRGWQDLTLREEKIAVRDAEPEVLTVRETRRGPLVGELLAGNRASLALKWTGALPGARLGGMLGLAHARNAADVRSALRLHLDPVVTVVFADTHGEGGAQVAGAIPLRELPTGGVPVPGMNRAYDWQRLMPFESLPARSLGPREPYLVVADGPVAKGLGIETFWRAGSRSRRLREQLDAGLRSGPLSLAALRALQTDAVSDVARSVVSAALAQLGDRAELRREAREVASLLEEWDGTSGADSRGAAAYQVFRERLLRALFEPVLGRERLSRYLALPRVQPDGLLLAALTQSDASADPESGWPQPGAVRDAVRISLRDAWIRLSVDLAANRERWTWGRLHLLRFEPLAPGNEGLARGLGSRPYGGDGSTLELAGFQALEGFDVTAVSAYRFAIDVGNPDQALTSLAPGQSEDPASPHASDRLETWLENGATLLSTSDPVIEDGGVAHLWLEPSS